MTFDDAIWTIDYKDGHEHTAYRTGEQMQTIYAAMNASEDSLFIVGFGKNRYHCERCEKAYVPDMYKLDNQFCLDCEKLGYPKAETCDYCISAESGHDVHCRNFQKTFEVEKAQCIDCGKYFDNALDHISIDSRDAMVIICNVCANRVNEDYNLPESTQPETNDTPWHEECFETYDR